MAKVLINIVTIEKDNFDGLARTINSLSRQNLDKELTVSHLICQSSTGVVTPPVIPSKLDGISRVVSTKDSGIYNAMNKGLLASEPGWIMFLNSGDELLGTNALQKVFEILQATDAPIVQFRTKYSDGSVHPRSDYRFWSLYFGREMHAHPSLFVNTTHFPSLVFDENYRIAGDYKFILNVVSLFKPVHCDEVISYFEGGGVSTTDIQAVIQEMNLVRIDLKPRFIPRALIHLWNWFVSIRIKMIISKDRK